MFHRIRSVTPLQDYRLSVQFVEGVTKQYDLKALFDKFPMFNIDDNLFREVKVDVGGYGISWNDDLDLSCDELWEHGEQVDNPFDGLISMKDATTMWNLNESTLRKSIAYGKLVNGIDVCKFGKQWVVAIDALIREYGQPTIKER